MRSARTAPAAANAPNATKISNGNWLAVPGRLPLRRLGDAVLFAAPVFWPLAPAVFVVEPLLRLGREAARDAFGS